LSKEINIERVFPNSIEQVWEALTTSEALAVWLMPNNFELKKGHKFQFNAPKQLGFDGIIHCEVIDFQIPSKLQYTWQGGPLKKPTMITFELSSLEEGTKMKFTQSGFEGFIGGYIVRFILGHGWKNDIFEKLKSYLPQ
jgi:uncharacterized protein YndB with AHSA1/START domain